MMNLNPNELPPPNGLAKIIRQLHRNEQGQTVAVSYARGDTGQIIGATVDQKALWGIGKNQMEFYFLSSDRCDDFLKKCCREYLEREDVDFLTEEAGNLIHLMPTTQPHRRV